MVVTRRITYQGSGPLLRTLVQALEGEGVTVRVRRNGPYVGQHRQTHGMGDAVMANLVVTGTIDGINAGVELAHQVLGITALGAPPDTTVTPTDSHAGTTSNTVPAAARLSVDVRAFDPAELARWFTRGADRKSLELYLETFAHTVGVMQERDAITRVAAECAEDLAADGIVYAEVRYAPELSTGRGLTLDEVVEASLEGFRLGSERAAAVGRPIGVRLIVTAMRQAARSVEVAEFALRKASLDEVFLALTGRPGGAADEARPRRPEDALLEECAELLEVEPLPVTADAEEAAAWRADVRKRAAARSGEIREQDEPRRKKIAARLASRAEGERFWGRSPRS